MNIKEELHTLIENFLAGSPYFLVNILIPITKQKITVYLDGDEGIGIDKCTEVSRMLGEYLEEHEFNNNHYVLEVSSPGIDHPLVLPRQYPKNIGRMVKINLKDQTEIKGTLLGVTASGVEVKPLASKKKKKHTEGNSPIQPDSLTIAFLDIKEAKVQIEFK